MPPLIELIRREIAASGVLPFARFMELALDCPNYGYYQAKKDNPGRRGDFFTSVSVGELFGQLLAFQFAAWLEELNSSPVTRHSSLCLIEAGAHDGTLANDILNWLQSNRPKLFEEIQYGILEPSPARQEWQQEKLAKFGTTVRWFSDFENLKLKTQNSKLNGVVFSNELLDAMPVHRFGWDAAAKKWFEWGVALKGDKFVWAKIPNSQFPISNSELPSSIFHLPSSLSDVLPDGYTVEISPAAENWWREAAGVLEHGRLMTIDYGLTADELFSPSRRRGTLRAYFRHHIADDILANPGEQDITAHVNFPAIQTAGESAGLTTESFSTQAQFLTRILEKAAKDKSFGDWNAARTRQFQTLTHPEHLGRAFRVLIQLKELPVIRS
jgi:SAM-dependent MidA family methyltransferase